MSKKITLLLFLLFFCSSLLVLATNEIEGEMGIDWVEWNDVDLDDLISSVGGGGDTNDGEYNEFFQLRLPVGGAIVEDLEDNTTGLINIAVEQSSIDIYKRNNQGYVLHYQGANAGELTYSIVSVLGTNYLSKRNLQGAYTPLETQGLPTGSYLVVLRRGAQLHKVFKIIL